MTGSKTKKRKGLWTDIVLHILFFVSPLLLMSVSYANPVLNSVVAGGINVQQTGSTVQVNQTTQRGIISWDSFNISAGEKTKFNQPNSSAVTLNRINAQQGPSRILGQITANGTIILVNGAGLFFGSGATVNVGSIIASTSNISNANFMAGKYIFDEPSKRAGAIINKGLITAGDYGVVALLGAQVENDGTIKARLGNIVLGSGSQFTLDFNGDQLITFAVTAPAEHPNVTNTGKLLANGGRILVTAAAAQGVLDNVINMAGYAEARSSAKQRDGSIVLSASNGNVVVSGRLIVAGTHHNGSGGKITITGNNVVLTKASIINANAGKTGKGGSVTIKASNSMQDFGKITALGGSLSGNGGSVETSGANIDVNSAKINLTAAHGQTGTWLIDPADLTISNNVTSNMNVAANTNTANQTSSGQVPNLNVADLENALSLANIVVQTSNFGAGGSGDITVMNNISWSSANSLTLSALRNINIDTGVTIANSGGATLALRSDNTGSGIGTVNFNGSAKINLSAGGAVNLYYNPSSYATPTDYTGVVIGVTPTAYMLVNTAANLAAVNSNLSGNFALGDNINLAANSAPIANSATPYTGHFDGQNFSISGLTIVDATAGGNIGLFGATSGATIANVHLQNVNITETAEANTVGALAGLAVNTRFINDSMTGTVKVTANNANHSIYVGGLVGVLEAGSFLADSYSTGAIDVTAIANNGGNLYVGGLAGAMAGSTVQNSYNSSFIQVSGQNNGGVVDIGGMAGVNGYDLFADAGSHISNSYSTGYINPTLVTNNGGTTNVGGFVGFENSSASLTSNFWDTGTSGFNENRGVGNISGAVSGVTAGCFSGNCGSLGGTANLSATNTYARAGWNVNGTWNVLEGSSYPYLTAAFPTTPEVISGTTAASGNTQVKLVTNGEVIDSIPTGANGFFYSLQAANTIAGNTAVLAYIPGMSGNDVFVVPSSGSGGISGLAIKANTITVGGDFASTVSNSNFASALGNLTDSSVLYSIAGPNLTIGTFSHPNIDFVATPQTTYNLDGNVKAVAGGSVNITFDGSAVLIADAAVTGNNVAFKNGINGSFYDLQIAALNTASLSNNVSLANLSVTASSTEVNASAITTAGVQDYISPVVFTQPITLTGTEFSFDGTVSGGTNLAIFGTGKAGSNTLSYADYTSGVDVGLNTNVNSGTVYDITSGNIIGEFNNIDNIVGNPQSVLQLPDTTTVLTLNSADSGTVGDPINFSQFSNIVRPNSGSAVFFETPSIVNNGNGQFTIDGVPVNLTGFNSENSGGDVVMQSDTPSNPNQERTKEQLNLITSYTNYVSNVPPSSGLPMPVYVADHVIVKEVSSSCTSSASADAENNITLSEGCAP